MLDWRRKKYSENSGGYFPSKVTTFKTETNKRII
jgi:hypothetical protein